MTLEKLISYLAKGKIEKANLVKNQRGESGGLVHLNLSVKSDAGAVRNFNIFRSDSVLYEYCLIEVERQGVEVRDISTEIEEGPVVLEAGYNLSADAQLWRYMDMNKFRDLLASSSIWFCRMDILQNTDSMEGRIPDAEFNALKSHYRSLNWAPVSYGNGKHVFGGESETNQQGMTYLTQEQISASNYSMFEEMEYYRPRNLYINCWHISEHENNGMWTIYGKNPESIAIVTNYKSLINSFGSDKDYKLHVGRVDYIDYEEESFKLSLIKNRFGRVLTKSRAFVDEKELRIFYEDHGFVNELIDSSIPYEIMPSDEVVENYKKGLKPKLDLECLIEKVIVNPDASDDFVEAVKNLVLEAIPRFDLSKVVKSDLRTFKPKRPVPFKYPENK